MFNIILQKLKRLYFKLFKTYIFFLVVAFINVFILLMISPLSCFFWLFFPTLYLYFNNRYYCIWRIWGFFFFIWYLIFTGCMFGYSEAIIVECIPITHPNGVSSIPGDCMQTYYVYDYVDHTYRFFRPYCFWKYRVWDICCKTLLALGYISSTLRIKIYVPSIFNGIFIFLKWIGEL